MSNSQLEFHAVRTIAMLPALLVMLVGVILALRKISVHPRACWAILAALALNAFNILGLPFLMSIVMQITGGFATTNDLLLRNLLWTLPYGLAGAVSWGLILFAVFDRPDPPKFLHEDDFPSDAPER